MAINKPNQKECCKTLQEIEDDIIKALLKIIPINLTHSHERREDSADINFNTLRRNIRKQITNYLNDTDI